MGKPERELIPENFRPQSSLSLTTPGLRWIFFAQRRFALSLRNVHGYCSFVDPSGTVTLFDCGPSQISHRFQTATIEQFRQAKPKGSPG